MKNIFAVMSLGSFFLLSSAAVAQDAGLIDDASYAGPCDDMPTAGRCEDDTVVYCTMGVYDEIDCSGHSLTGSQSESTCGLVDCTLVDCYGYGCVAKSGESCLQGEPCDVSANEGCIDGVCTVSTVCDPATDTIVTCDGAVATFCDFVMTEHDCSEGATVPYTCAVPVDAITDFCVGLAGADCGDDPNGHHHLCGEGLECVGGLCSAVSLGHDAGTATSDGGSTVQADAATASESDAANDEINQPGCGCSVASNTSPVALIAGGLLILVVIRRRRR